MAKYYLTNKAGDEYGVIMEADSSQDAIEKYYRRVEPLYDYGIIESYNQLNKQVEIKEDIIKKYCEENNKNIDDLDVKDYLEITQKWI